MRLIDRLSGGLEERQQATAWGDWPGDPVAWSGSNVSNRTSLQLLTVYGCVRLIADSIATLPLDVYRKVGDENEEISTPRWLYNPTVELDRTAWCTQVLTSLLLAGNAYLWLERETDGSGIKYATPLDPARVQIRREAGRKQFWVDGVLQSPLTIGHIPALMFPGADVGLSPVEAARQSIGLGMATSRYGSQFFDGPGNMPGVIEAPGDIPPEAAQGMARAWRKFRREGGTGLPGVLTGGATWKPTGVTNEQAQFLMTRRYTAAEIAGQMFLLDPADLGIGVEGTSLTYANLEQRNLRRVQVTLLPWIIRLEHWISSVLANPRYVKFNVDGLLRADLKTRYEAAQIGITSGFLLRSEARDHEDLPVIDGIDDQPAPTPPVGGPNAPAF